MYFESVSALLYMDGHGVYVWAAYLLATVVVTAIVVVPWRRRRRLLRQYAGEARRRQGASGKV